MTNMPPYSIHNIGKWDELSAKKEHAPGKIFLSELLNLTCMDISVNALKPGWLNPYLHNHKSHEELYVFIKGSGEMKLNDEMIQVREGDMVRVAPSAARGVRNPQSNSEELWFICVRAAKENFNPKDELQSGRINGVEGWSLDWLKEQIQKRKK